MDALHDILKHYGMPEENIESAITQIAQGYGAQRYLEGVDSGAKAVSEMGESLEKENADKYRAEIDAKEEEKRKKKAIDRGVGCLNAVRAMLDLSRFGCTHRQRNFYNESIMKYIDIAIGDMEAEKEPMPF